MPYAGRFGPGGIVMPAETAREGKDYQPGEIREYQLTEEELSRYRASTKKPPSRRPVGLVARKPKGDREMAVKLEDVERSPTATAATRKRLAVAVGGGAPVGEATGAAKGSKWPAPREELEAMVVEGLSNQEIAERYGTTEKAVYSRLNWFKIKRTPEQRRARMGKKPAAPKAPAPSIEAAADQVVATPRAEAAAAEERVRFVAHPDELPPGWGQVRPLDALRGPAGVEMAGRIVRVEAPGLATDGLVLWDSGDGIYRPLGQVVREFLGSLGDEWLGQEIVFRIGPAE